MPGQGPGKNKLSKEENLMAGSHYISVNITKEQHEKLKRIADFKKSKITDVGVENGCRVYREIHG